MTLFEDAIRNLDRLGVADVLLPFLLIFVLSYAVLQKTRVLGSEGEGDNAKPKKKFNVVVAFVLGMIVVFTHVLYEGSAYDVVPIINDALPILLLALVGVLALGLLVGMFSGKSMKSWDGAKNYFYIAAFVFIVWTFLAVTNYVAVPRFLQSIFYNQALINTIIAVVVFIAIIMYVTGSKDNDPNASNGPGTLEKLFGK